MGLFRKREQEDLTKYVDDVLLRALITGESITREEALEIPSVNSAVDFICNTFAMVQFKLYEEEVDENGKKIKFKSSVDALSYFEKLGWSVVSAYSVVAYNGLANVPTVRYLLKKKVASYDEKMDGIRTKKSEPKKKIDLGDDGYFE